MTKLKNISERRDRTGVHMQNAVRPYFLYVIVKVDLRTFHSKANHQYQDNFAMHYLELDNSLVG